MPSSTTIEKQRAACQPRSGGMRALRLLGPGSAPYLARVPRPRAWSGEVVLRVLASGVCHTELQLQDGALNPGVWPLTLGHEIVGQVVEAAEARDWLGRRALVYYSSPCGECSWCLAGQEHVCPNAGSQPGLSADGGFAEAVRVPVSSLVELPDDLLSVDAAPLGCAAATALHAVDAVARVSAAETIVVYGVGGVGLPLIQLARMRGARVIAVSRSAARLELAQTLGSEVVDAQRVDPALAVRDLTRGEGAHVVFELVGSDVTMPAALAMLRRQGRLVFVGYGNSRLNLNPLQMVVRETRILTSFGNTRAELREVVRLAAAGRLHVPLAGVFALEDGPLVLDKLRAGLLLGRAVLDPALAPTLDSVDQPWPAAVASRAVPRPAPRTPPDMRSAAHGALLSNGETRALPVIPVPPSARQRDEAGELVALEPSHESQRLEADLLEFVGRGIDASRNDAEFNALAVRLFSYQFDHVQPYRLLCQRRGRDPSVITHWRDIPALPIAAFKETLLLAEPGAQATEFNSSGTLQPEHKSRHLHPRLALYDLNARLNFKAHVMPDRDRLRLLVLFQPRHELPHSSLAHWLSLQVESVGTADSDWYVSNSQGLAADRLVAALRAVESSAQPVGVLAASFGLVHFLEHCLAADLSFRLPTGSRVMDTGGYKGRSREYAKDELYALVTQLLGVPPTRIVNMYGMTEHGTQFLDTILRDDLAHPEGTRERFKVAPPWARTLVVDPETLREVGPGQRGLLLHYDLINRASAMAVLSEDVGQYVADGFEVLGRAQGAAARGCSIALDELIDVLRATPA